MLSRVLPTAARATLAPWTTMASMTVRPTVAAPVRLTSVTDAFAHLRVVEEPLSTNAIVMECLNRNARRPKKANHGKRPCSHVARRQKRLAKKGGK